MMIEPNLPTAPIRCAIVSSDLTPCMRSTLEACGISLVTVTGNFNCDPAVKNHPDIYVSHLSAEILLFSGNVCSTTGDMPKGTKNVNILLNKGADTATYKNEVFFNCVSIGKDLICNPKLIHPCVMEFAESLGRRVISVKQGYTKCNLCVVDERSVITEDKGIAKVLSEYGYYVLLLESGSVKLRGHEYGFIGGASGKISDDKLAFFGNIEAHPQYRMIYDFLDARGVEAVSLSYEPLTDFGSLIPVL